MRRPASSISSCSGLVAAVVVVALVCAAARTARADMAPAPVDTYAVIAIDITGDADPELRAQLDLALGRGLADAGVGHVAFEDVQKSLRAKPSLVGCSTTTCLDQIGAIVGANRFLTAHVDAEGAAYKIELVVLTSDGPVGRRSAACSVCTISDLGELLQTKAKELVTGPSTQPVSVTVATVPGGGEISVADAAGQAGSLRPLGKAPASLSLPPGTYLVEVKLAGYSILRQQITVSEQGEAQSFQLTLTRAGESGAHRPYKLAKWGGAGVSAIAIATGVVLLAMDGSGTCGTDPCPEIHGTAGAGIAALGAGIVVGAATGYMFWHDARDARRASVVVAPTHGGAAAAIRVRF